MTEEQVFEFIRKSYEDKKIKSWDEIAKLLQKAGHVSTRTNRPLIGNAVRHIYYNFNKKPPIPKSELKTKLDSIRSVLKLKGDSEMKLKLIEQMIDSLEV